MRLIKPSFEILDTNGYDINGIYKDIERASRICYKSESNITEGSAKKMVDSLIRRGHTSCLEHGTVYLKIPFDDSKTINTSYYPPAYVWGIQKYLYNNYSKVCIRRVYSANHQLESSIAYISTNYRVLLENGWLDDLQYLCEPTEYQEKRISVKFITNIGVTREGNRHRKNSIVEQSTRYCNYMKEKFNMAISYCPPTWFNLENCTRPWINKDRDKLPIGSVDYDGSQCLPEFYFKGNEDYKPEYIEHTKIQSWTADDFYIFSCLVSEFCYENLIRLGRTPQEARAVLNLSTQTEVIYTAYISDWLHFFSLRADESTGKVHPDMLAVAKPLKEEFIKRGYISNN